MQKEDWGAHRSICTPISVFGLNSLNHRDTVTAEQDSQNFAMLLLENSNILASVYTTVVTQMMSK